MNDLYYQCFVHLGDLGKLHVYQSFPPGMEITRDQSILCVLLTTFRGLMEPLYCNIDHIQRVIGTPVLLTVSLRVSMYR